MTDQEILAMQGTEFTYVFEDGDTMPAYIKKIDLERNIMSCWSFSLVTDQGYKFEPKNKDEKNEGAICVMSPESKVAIIRRLRKIQNTGKYVSTGILGGFSGCNF